MKLSPRRGNRWQLGQHHPWRDIVSKWLRRKCIRSDFVRTRLSGTVKLKKKKNPRAYFFQRPFFRGLFLEGLMFGAASIQRENCVTKSIRLVGRKFVLLHCFCFALCCIWGQFPSVSSPEALYSEGRFTGGFFVLRVWEAYIWRRLFSEFYGTSRIVSN